MALTATRLRATLYRVLEQVARSGEPIEVMHRGEVIRLSRASPRRQRNAALATLLEPHPDALTGKLEDIVQLDWSKNWRWR
jgi:hypothetical protein